MTTPWVNYLQAGIALTFTWLSITLALTQLFPDVQIWLLSLVIAPLSFVGGYVITRLHYTLIISRPLHQQRTVEQVHAWAKAQLQTSNSSLTPSSASSTPSVPTASRDQRLSSQTAFSAEASRNRSGDPAPQVYGGHLVEESDEQSQVAEDDASETGRDNEHSEEVLRVRDDAVPFRKRDMISSVEAERGFQFMMREFPNSPLSFLFAAAYFEKARKNHVEECIALARAQQVSSTGDVQFQVYRRARMVGEEVGRGLSPLDRVLFDQYQTQAAHLRVQVYRTVQLLWETLATPIPSLDVMTREAQSFSRRLERLEQVYKKILQVDPSPAACRQYGTFLSEFHIDEEKAQEYLNRAARMDEKAKSSATTHKRKVIDFRVGHAGRLSENFQGKSATITVSAFPDDAGDIQKVSAAALALLGYSSGSHLVGRNVSTIMCPGFLRHHFASLMLDVRGKYGLQLLNHNRQWLLTTRSGALLPVWMQATEAQPGQSTCKPRINLTFTEIATDQEVAVFVKDGVDTVLLGATSNLLRTVRMSGTELESEPPLASLWFPTITSSSIEPLEVSMSLGQVHWVRQLVAQGMASRSLLDDLSPPGTAPLLSGKRTVLACSPTTMTNDVLLPMVQPLRHFRSSSTFRSSQSRTLHLDSPSRVIGRDGKVDEFFVGRMRRLKVYCFPELYILTARSIPNAAVAGFIHRISRSRGRRWSAPQLAKTLIETEHGKEVSPKLDSGGGEAGEGSGSFPVSDPRISTRKSGSFRIGYKSEGEDVPEVVGAGALIGRTKSHVTFDLSNDTSPGRKRGDGDGDGDGDGSGDGSGDGDGDGDGDGVAPPSPFPTSTELSPLRKEAPISPFPALPVLDRAVTELPPNFAAQNTAGPDSSSSSMSDELEDDEESSASSSSLTLNFIPLARVAKEKGELLPEVRSVKYVYIAVVVLSLVFVVLMMTWAKDQADGTMARLDSLTFAALRRKSLANAVSSAVLLTAKDSNSLSKEWNNLALQESLARGLDDFSFYHNSLIEIGAAGGERAFSYEVSHEFDVPSSTSNQKKSRVHTLITLGAQITSTLRAISVSFNNTSLNDPLVQGLLVRSSILRKELEHSLELRHLDAIDLVEQTQAISIACTVGVSFVVVLAASTVLVFATTSIVSKVRDTMMTFLFIPRVVASALHNRSTTILRKAVQEERDGDGEVGMDDDNGNVQELLAELDEREHEYQAALKKSQRRVRQVAIDPAGEENTSSFSSRVSSFAFGTASRLREEEVEKKAKAGKAREHISSPRTWRSLLGQLLCPLTVLVVMAILTLSLQSNRLEFVQETHNRLLAVVRSDSFLLEFTADTTKELFFGNSSVATHFPRDSPTYSSDRAVEMIRVAAFGGSLKSGSVRVVVEPPKDTSRLVYQIVSIDTCVAFSNPKVRRGCRLFLDGVMESGAVVGVTHLANFGNDLATASEECRNRSSSTSSTSTTMTFSLQDECERSLYDLIRGVLLYTSRALEKGLEEEHKFMVEESRRRFDLTITLIWVLLSIFIVFALFIYLRVSHYATVVVRASRYSLALLPHDLINTHTPIRLRLQVFLLSLQIEEEESMKCEWGSGERSSKVTPSE